MLFARRAAADPASIVFDYSPYEWEAIHDAEVVLLRLHQAVSVSLPTVGTSYAP
jgi:hypothetical protein